MSDSVELIKSMPDFIKAMQVAMQTPWGWIILLVLATWFFINKVFNNFFELLERKENKKLERLEKHLSTNFNREDVENIDYSKEENAVAKDIWDAIHFKNATGIYAERKLRKHLIRLYNSTSSNIKWNTIKKASVYIEVCSCGDIYIRKMDFMEWFIYLYNGFVGILFLLSSFGLCLLAIYIHEADTTLIYLLGSALFCLLISMFVFSQNWSNIAAKKIKKELTNNTLPSRTERVDDC